MTDATIISFIFGFSGVLVAAVIFLARWAATEYNVINKEMDKHKIHQDRLSDQLRRLQFMISTIGEDCPASAPPVIKCEQCGRIINHNESASRCDGCGKELK